MDNGLPELPGELADKISSYLPPSDVANMSKTSKALHSSLKHRTISRAETLRSRLETALFQNRLDPFYDVIYEALITYVTKYPFMYRRSMSGTTTAFMTWYEPNPNRRTLDRKRARDQDTVRLVPDKHVECIIAVFRCLQRQRGAQHRRANRHPKRSLFDRGAHV